MVRKGKKQVDAALHAASNGVEKQLTTSGSAAKNAVATSSEDGDTGSISPPMDVSSWSCEQVALWLHRKQFARYADLFAYEHGIDGDALLLLTESDLRQPPLQLNILGDIKKLGQALSELRSKQRQSHTVDGSPFQRDAIQFLQPQTSTPMIDYKTTPNSSMCACAGSEHHHSIPTVHPCSVSMQANGVPKELFAGRDYLIRQVESPDSKSKSIFKTSVAFVYCMASLLITAFAMVIVHDRVPDMKTYPPLPDIVLDNLPLIPWAFEVCEICALTMAFLWFTVLLLHKHRMIVMRRMFSLVGTVFLLRCVTMLITSLSVPGVHLECSSKSYGNLWDKMRQAYHIWSNMGLSVKGVRNCGDYMFSGHTTAITLLNHFITEYTPESWHFLHTSTWVLNLFGIFFILAGHEHYSIDVFIAFYISSRLFLYYHALAYNNSVNPLSQTDVRTRMWFPLSWFFESGGYGRVANEYELPLPSFETLYDLATSCANYVHELFLRTQKHKPSQQSASTTTTAKENREKRRLR